MRVVRLNITSNLSGLKKEVIGVGILIHIFLMTVLKTYLHNEYSTHLYVVFDMIAETSTYNDIRSTKINTEQTARGQHIGLSSIY